MSCGDSNTCAQGTVHTQGSSLSCDTVSQFSAKRHQKKDCSVFLIGWNPRKTSAAIAPAAASTSWVQRKHPQDSKKKEGGGRGKGTITKPFWAHGKNRASFTGPLKKCLQMPTNTNPSVRVQLHACVWRVNATGIIFPVLSFTTQNKPIF